VRQSVVVIYVDEIGPGFNVVFNWQGTDGNHRLATSAQKTAIKRFFDIPVDKLCSDEATQLLDFRDYAQAATSVLFASESMEQISFIEKCIAAYIGADTLCAASVSKWADRRFANAADPLTVANGIKRSKPFPSVRQFFNDLIADINDVAPGFLPPQSA
jgi:hypothetical protein